MRRAPLSPYWQVARRSFQRYATYGGVTAVLTTHDLGDVERLCSRLVVVDRGRLGYGRTVEDVKARDAPHRTLVVDLEPGSPPPPGAVRSEGPRHWIRFHQDEATAAEIVSTLVGIRDLTVEEPESRRW